MEIDIEKPVIEMTAIELIQEHNFWIEQFKLNERVGLETERYEIFRDIDIHNEIVKRLETLEKIKNIIK